MHLEDIDAGDSEKSFLIRSEAVEYVSHCLSLFSEERLEGGCRRLAEEERDGVNEKFPPLFGASKLCLFLVVGEEDWDDCESSPSLGFPKYCCGNNEIYKANFNIMISAWRIS